MLQNLPDINLGSGLTFETLDFRGVATWPVDDTGLVYQHVFDETVVNRFTGVPKQITRRFVIRIDPTVNKWRIDELKVYGPAEAVYGVDGETHWNRPEDAASALEAALTEWYHPSNPHNTHNVQSC